MVDVSSRCIGGLYRYDTNTADKRCCELFTKRQSGLLVTSLFFHFSAYFLSIYFFRGPAGVAWLGGAHQDSRFRRGLGGTMSPAYEVSIRLELDF